VKACVKAIIVQSLDEVLKRIYRSEKKYEEIYYALHGIHIETHKKMTGILPVVPPI